MNYVLFGEEHYRLKKTLDTIVHQSVDEINEFSYTKYDASAYDLKNILEDANTISFFCEHKVIVVEHATFLSTKNDTTYDLKLLEQYVNHPNDDCTLIFVGDFDKLDKRKKVVKEICKKWKVLEFKKLDELGKSQLVKEEIKNRKLKIDSSALHELISRLPLDMDVIYRYFDKLELYGDTLDIYAIKQLVSKPLEDNVFVLSDAIIHNDFKKAYDAWLDLVILKVEPIALIALLVTSFRLMYQVKVLSLEGKKQNEMQEILGIHPYRIKLALQSVSGLSLHELSKKMAELSILDQQIKTGQLDKNVGFELYLLEMIGD